MSKPSLFFRAIVITAMPRRRRFPDQEDHGPESISTTGLIAWITLVATSQEMLYRAAKPVIERSEILHMRISVHGSKEFMLIFTLITVPAV